MLNKALTIKGWIILIAISLVLSIMVSQHLQINKRDFDIQALTTDLDHSRNENSELVGKLELQERVRQKEMSSLKEQMEALSDLRSRENEILEELRALKERESEVEDFFNIPIPNSLRGLRLKSQH